MEDVETAGVIIVFCVEWRDDLLVAPNIMSKVGLPPQTDYFLASALEL
jgi:hypothetical protein